MTKVKKGGWPKEEKTLEKLQRAKMKSLLGRIFKGEDYDRHRKADKKMGGVRGKFHPSLERTRKRT